MPNPNTKKRKKFSETPNKTKPNFFDTTSSADSEDADDADDEQEKETNPATRYELSKTKKADTFVKKFKKTPINQTTASAFHPIKSNFVGADKLVYRRNQKAHPYSDVNNPIAMDVDSNNATQLFLKDSNSYNFGRNKTFGVQINQKISNINNEEEHRPITDKIKSDAKKKLDDEILKHKNKAVTTIVTQLNQNQKKSKLQTILIDENQLKAEYPCVIIRLNNAYKQHQMMIQSNVKNEYTGAYPKFLTHLLIACINKQLYENKVGVYFDRRQSFGFLTPTASDVGSAIRLSIGLVPNQKWIQSVVQGIQNFDVLLKKLWEQQSIQQGKTELGKSKPRMGTPHRIFRSGNIQIYSHKLLLEELLKGDSAIIEYTKTLNEKYQSVRSKDEAEGRFTSLTRQILNKPDVVGDQEFETLYQQVDVLYDNLLEIPKTEQPSKKRKTTQASFSPSAHQKMDALDQKMNQYKIKSVEDVSKLNEMDVSSDSEGSEDSEDSENDVVKRMHKHYTPTGMSALSVPLFVYEKIFREERNPIRYKMEPYAYFELAGWNNQLSKTFIKKTDNYAQANIIYADNNPCVNGEAASVDIMKIISDINESIKVPIQSDKSDIRPKMLIVDTTSATQAQIEAIKDAWKKSNIAILCFSSSGLKNQQVGLDMAQYGETRVFLNPTYLNNFNSNKTKNQMLSTLVDFQKEMRELTRASSSAYSTEVRRKIRENVPEQNSEESTTQITPSFK